MPGSLVKSSERLVRSLRLREPGDNFVKDGIGTGLNLLFGLVLYGMRDVNRVKVGTIERRCLGPRSRLKFTGRDRNGRHSKILQVDCVVQTARCAGSSIGQGLHDGVDGAKLFDDAGRRRLGKRWFRRAHNLRYVKSFAKQVVEPIQEEVASGFTDIQQSHNPPL